MRESGQAHYGRNFTSLSKNDKASYLTLRNWNMIWYANKSTILIGNGKNCYFNEGFMQWGSIIGALNGWIMISFCQEMAFLAVFKQGSSGDQPVLHLSKERSKEIVYVSAELTAVF